MDLEESTECLLVKEDSQGLIHEKQFLTSHKPPHRRTYSLTLTTGLGLALLVSILFNTFLFTQLQTARGQSNLCRSPYTDLPFDKLVTYSPEDDWWGENETRSNELWNSLNTDGAVISLTDEDASSRGLELSSRFPWDENRGLYFIKGLHDMHCLKMMRNYTGSLVKGESSPVTWHHYQHCLNALRQDVMCHADDTPMPAVKGKHIGEGQVLRCRDWDRLQEWTKAPGQNACYRQLSDIRTPTVAIERHAFCPEGSPYQEVADEYFRKHGHKDPWG